MMMFGNCSVILVYHKSDSFGLPVHDRQTKRRLSRTSDRIQVECGHRKDDLILLQKLPCKCFSIRFFGTCSCFLETKSLTGQLRYLIPIVFILGALLKGEDDPTGQLIRSCLNFNHVSENLRAQLHVVIEISHQMMQKGEIAVEVLGIQVYGAYQLNGLLSKFAIRLLVDVS